MPSDSHASAKADVHEQAGQARMRERQWDAAVLEFRKALDLDPARAMTQASLGYCFEQLGQLEEAVVAYQAAQALHPHSHEIAFNLGNALRLSGKLDEAGRAYERTLALAPGHARALNNLGTVRQLAGDIDQAIRPYLLALAAKPDYADALSNLASAHMARNEVPVALGYYRQALEIEPQSDRIRFNEGVARLLAGDLPAGWEGYERRARMARDSKLGPLWDGRSSLEGQRLLVTCEQGLGDTLQCVRYLPLLRARCGQLFLQAQPPLLDLLAAQGFAESVTAVGHPLPQHDFHISLLSLPWVFQTSLETIPRKIPYLHPLHPKPPGNHARLRVGIAWSGNPVHRHDRWRSIPFASLAAIGDGLNVHLVSLQKEVSPAESLRLGSTQEDRPAVLDDFAQTADLIAELDLVISVDTAVAHLAGAMGKPLWILLAFSPDWRWLLLTQKSPWYPTATLFRQEKLGDWTHVLSEITRSLERSAKTGSA